MDFLSSIRQLSLDLHKIQERNTTGDHLLDSDIENLSRSLAEGAHGEPEIDDPVVSKFMLQLHLMIESSHKDQKTLQQLLTIMEEFVNNKRVRKVLQDRGFISLLAHILQSDDHNTQILSILQKMTKNLEMKQPELYLTTLIPFLVDAITPDEPEHSRRCLRVLVNLCESRSAVDTLYKLCNTKELCKKLIASSFGFLTVRLFYRMDVRVNNSESTSLALATAFKEIEESLLEGDTEACEEGFAFVRKFAAEALEVCPDAFRKHLTGLLEKLKSAEVEAVRVPGLHLFSALIKDNNSLECFNEPLMDFALDNLSHLEALNLLQALGEKNFALGSATVERLSGMWRDLAGGLDQDVRVEKCVATLRLLRVFVQHPQHQASILEAVSRSSVRRLLEVPVNVSVESLADQQILLALESLDLLTTFAAVEPQEWYGEAEEALKTPEIVQLIAEGFARRSEEMFKCCLNLAKFTKFPIDSITGLLYGSPVRKVPPAMRFAPPEDTYSPLQVLKEQTDQIRALLSDFIESPGDLTKSSAAFLQQHQDMYQRQVEKFQEEQIEAGRRQVTFLQQQIASLTTERVAMRTIICQNQIAEEKAHLHIAECEKTIKQMEASLMQMHNKIKSNAQEAEKLQLKVAECEEAKLRIKEIKESLKIAKETEQQQIKTIEYLQKVIDEMKKEAITRSARIQHLEKKVKESEDMKQKIAHFMNGGE